MWRVHCRHAIWRDGDWPASVVDQEVHHSGKRVAVLGAVRVAAFLGLCQVLIDER